MNTSGYYPAPFINSHIYKKPLSHNSDESGCEADMAEGGQEDDSGDVSTRYPSKLEQVEAPLNLRTEGSDDSNPPSPDQYPQPKEEQCSLSSEDTSKKATEPTPKLDTKTAEMVQHLLMMNSHHDNKMAALHNYQSLQNLASGLQNLNSVNSLVAGLQSLSGLQNAPSLPSLAAASPGLMNTPLNLSVAGTNGLMAGNPQLLAPQPAAMPQFILASGQLLQGIQGAQLLIPTSQGIATQTILTIPVSHVTANQMVNLALSNGQVITTTLAQLQSMSNTHPLLNNTSPSPVTTSSNLLGFSGLPTHQQQLLNAMQQQPQLVSNPVLNSMGVGNNPSNKSPVHRTHHSYSSPVKSELNGPLSSSANSNGHVPHGCNNALTAISRLTANNADITITTMSGHQTRPADSMDQYRRERSESPMSDTCDLLDDSPNEPMISEVQSNVVDGINLDEMKEFAKAFKLRRLSLGLTQTQVGQALSVTEGPAYSQSAICSALASQVLSATTRHQAMFEKLDITPKSAQKIKPVLERWMKEAEERFKSGQNHLTEFIGMEPSKKRKRRTSFTPQALELLNVHFERNTHPSGTEITALAHQLGYEREVIRIWFCNKRQALKNTVRMMSKGGVGGGG